MRMTCAILLVIGVAAAPCDVPAQQTSSGRAGAQILQPPGPAPAVPGLGAQPTNAMQTTAPRSPSDGYSRPGGVSYRYDALGRIIEIVRTPAR